MTPWAHLLADTLAPRVTSHVNAYYAQIRRQLEQYKNDSVRFPDFFIGPRRVEAMLGSDGIVVAHYFAEQDLFTFTTEERLSADIMDRVCGMAIRGNGPLTGLTWYCDEHRSRIALMAIGERDKLAIAEWSSDLSSQRWSQETGRHNAEHDFLTRLTATLLGLRALAPTSAQDTLEARTQQGLEDRIKAFRTLLDTSPPEACVQKFLEQNPILLDPMAAKITPQVQLGEKYRADFVVERRGDKYILVEIEQPGHKLVTKGGDLAAIVNHAVRQITDWTQWIHENWDYARKIAALSGADDPAGRVIIGRRPESLEDIKQIRKANKLHPTLTIESYDDLLDQAEQSLQNLRNFP
jgi:hypothetical protein